MYANACEMTSPVGTIKRRVTFNSTKINVAAKEKESSYVPDNIFCLQRVGFTCVTLHDWVYVCK